VLAEGATGHTQRSAGAIVSFCLHGAALLAAVALTAGVKEAKTRVDKPLTFYEHVPSPPKQLAVTFQDAAPAGSPKPSRPAQPARAQAPQTPAAKPPPADLARAAVNPAAAPLSLETSDGGSGTSDGPPDAPPGPGSPGGGTGTGTGTGTGSSLGYVPFGEGMTQPRRIAGADPAYPREALQARVEGKVIAKCVIATDGTLRNCAIIKGLPYMDQAVLQALATQRYTPVLFQGRPTAVSYNFKFSFTLP
ncbi:MAG TPA: energy transducer TonB, partial [Polyangiaceae bacterium]|nr:energy transducer TonB [Polyangiaceae bacterium]